MEKMLSFSRMPKMFRRMFWRNYFVFALIVTLFAFLFSVWMFHTVTIEHNKQAVQIAEKLAETVDQWLTDCQQMSFSVGQLQNLLDLSSHGSSEMDFSELDAVLLSRTQHTLVAARATRPNVSHLAVYLYNRKYVVTDAGTLELDEFYQKLFASPSLPQSPYLRRLGPGKFLFLRQDAVSNTIPNAPVYVTSVIDQHGKQYGNLFLFWNSREVDRTLYEITGQDAYYSIYDADGNAVFCSDSMFLSREDLLAQLQEMGEQPVDRTVNSFSGWTVYTGLPISILHQRLWELSFLLFAAWCCILACGGIIVLNLCHKNYAPISALAYSISEQSPDEISQEMEYEALVAAIASITDSKKSAEAQLEIYKPILINSLLIELLDGFQDQSITLTALHALGCSFPYPIWQCISVQGSGIRLDCAMSFAEDLRIPDKSICFAASYNCRCCVFLLNAVSEEICLASAKALQKHLDSTDIVCAWGISEQVPSPAHLEKAYQQTQKVLNYAVLDTQSKGRDWVLLEQSGIFTVRQPDSLNHLFATILSGRITETRNVIEDYFSRIIYNGYSSIEALCSLHDILLSACQRLSDEYQLSFPYKELSNWQPNAPNSIHNLYDVAMEICDTLQNTMESCLSEQQKLNDLAFLSYLNDHLLDENLSLTTLADHFHLSESAASRRIRALTSLNFLDYVNQKRIEHAGTLLMHSDVSINDLAKAIGYGSDITFRRVFKKYMGVTPSEYRKKGPHI